MNEPLTDGHVLDVGIARMQDGGNPSTGYCRICGEWAVPPYEGPYAVGVCSMSCYDEWRWRQTLRNMRKPYRRKVEVG